jgi:Ca-activated chloride channel family protein
MPQFLAAGMFFLVLIPISIALYLFYKKRKSEQLYFFTAYQRNFKSLKTPYRLLMLLQAAAFILLIIAIAKPYSNKPQVEKQVEGIDIMLALDVSISMVAEDLEPSRFDVAKKVLTEFVDNRIADRIGLVIFEGEALTKVPLTLDYPFLKSQIQSLSLRELKQGTAIGMALALSIVRLKKSTAKTKIILLITDGDSNVGSVNPLRAAEIAREENIKIYSVGIGKADRVEVPIYIYDENGNKKGILTKIPSYLNPELLEQISKIANGKAYTARTSLKLKSILQEIDTLEKSKLTTKKFFKQENLERPFAFAALGLLLLVQLFLYTRYYISKYVPV